MMTLDRHDLEAIQAEARSEWEYNHHGLECPFTADIGYADVADDELAWEIEMIKEVSPWA